MEEQFIGDYKILKQIGAGGMARVYLAVHRNVPDFKVILKMLSDRRLAERFKQEANKLALLEGHRNVCQIKHFFSHGEDTVIAMEYIDGATIDDKIKDQGKLPLNEALEIIAAVLDTLDFAHRKGIYHRDIKPSNIMIDKKGQVKIIDFGIAKAETDPSLTLAGSACGTPAYMAPEQFTPTHDTNYALVDIYAAGTTLFTMLTGECPYQGDNEFAIRDAKLFSDVPKLRSHNTDIPKKVEDLVVKAMAKEPQNRFQTINEMQAALDAARREIKTGVSPDEAEMTVAVPTRPAIKKRKKSPRRLIAVAAIVLVLAAAAIYLFIPKAEETGTIFVSIDPDGDIYIDDSIIGAGLAAKQVALKPGQHVVQVRNDKSIESAFVDTVWVYTDSTIHLRHEFTFPVPKGTIEVSVTPSGDIYVDDSLLERGQSYASLTCDTGLHVVRVENRKSSEKKYQDTVMVKPGGVETRSYIFSFPSVAQDTSVASRPPVPDSGKVAVGSTPRGADIYIDGQLMSHPTPYTFTVETGRHVIKATSVYEGQVLAKEDTILVEKNTTQNVTFKFDE
jgi:serine/threonine protein kinase